MTDFWPGFLGLDNTAGGRGVLGGGGKYSFARLLGRRNTVYSSTGTEKYSVTILFTIHYSISKKSQNLF